MVKDGLIFLGAGIAQAKQFPKKGKAKNNFILTSTPDLFRRRMT